MTEKQMLEQMKMLGEMMEMMKEMKEENNRLSKKVEELENGKKKTRKEKKKRTNIRKTYPIKDRELFSNFLNELPDLHRLIVYVGVSTSLRVTDVLGIQLKEILDDEGKLSLKEFIAQKTGKDLTIEINAFREEILFLLNKLGINDPEQYVFASGYGENGHLPISRQGVWKMFKRIAEKVGIQQRIGTHFMRKTFAYWFLQANPNSIGELMQMLGHEDQDTTLKYITVTNEELQGMSDRGLNLLKEGK